MDGQLLLSRTEVFLFVSMTIFFVNCLVFHSHVDVLCSLCWVLI